MRVITRLLPVLFIGLFFGLINCSSETSKACQNNDDCIAGQQCIDGKCKVIESEGVHTDPDGGTNKEAPPLPPCKGDIECGAGKLCKNGFCHSVPDPCDPQKANDCGSAMFCNPDTKKCERVKCRYDEECPDGQACDKIAGICLPAVACEKTDDCPENWVCNTCRKVCTTSLNSGKCDHDYNCPGGIELSWCDQCIKECRSRLKICEPCTRDEECGEEEDHCLPDLKDPNSKQKFCGRRCYQDTFCSPGFRCENMGKDKYKYPFQCIPASKDCRKPGECQSNADCAAAGKVCDVRTRLCVAGCQVDENCPVRSMENCTNDADCSNPRAKCQTGKCTLQMTCCRGICGIPCSTDSECDRQETCDSGCCKLEGECQTSRDCPTQHYCDQTSGLCTPGCQVANDCGLPDPQKQRCRFKCENNKCLEDCTCRNPHLDCPAVRFCPDSEVQNKDPLAPCRKPKGPICQPCSSDEDCGCKEGDDCRYICTRKQCQKDDDCKALPNGANTCYNGRCSTKKACRANADCPNGEKCENSYCAENCNNICLKLQSGARCFTGCDPKGDGSECPSRLSCIELLPQDGSGPKCTPDPTACKTDSECPPKFPRCGEDGYCTDCGKGLICRNFNPRDPLDTVCIDMPPTICASIGGDLCADGGF